MFHVVYVLQSKVDSGLYIGYTKDVKKRLREHNLGKNFSTKLKRPWQLIFFEGYLNQKDATRREDYLKTSQGSRLLKRMLKEFMFLQKSKNN